MEPKVRRKRKQELVYDWMKKYYQSGKTFKTGHVLYTHTIKEVSITQIKTKRSLRNVITLTTQLNTPKRFWTRTINDKMNDHQIQFLVGTDIEKLLKRYWKHKVYVEFV